MKSLSDLEAEIRQKKARLQRQESRIGQIRKRVDTRRKILAGAWVLHRAEDDADFRTLLCLELPQFLQARDRSLFAELFEGGEE